MNKSQIKAARAVLGREYDTLAKRMNQIDRKLSHLNDVESGDSPDPKTEKLIKTQKFSFTVHFQRAKALKKVRSPGLVCKSLRRFATRKEAIQHGSRFTKIQGHKGYKVIRVDMRANAWINWVTGKTNPVLA